MLQRLLPSLEGYHQVRPNEDSEAADEEPHQGPEDTGGEETEDETGGAGEVGVQKGGQE